MSDSLVNFENYLEYSHTRLRKSLLTSSFVISCFIFVIEFFMYTVLKNESDRTDINSYYIFIRIVVPAILNFGSFLICSFINSSSRFSSRKKNFFSAFSFFVICFVLATFHNFFQILLISPVFSFLLCSIFGDRKILKTYAICTIPSFTIAVITFCLDPETGTDYYKFLTIVAAVSILLGSFKIANIILGSQAEKIKYISQTYERQTSLIEELRIDPLTKLYNRIALQEAISSLISRAAEEKINPSLGIIDLDFFKSINDHYGHISGDQVLIRISEIIRETMGTSRKSFRFGGEELVLLFDDCDSAQVKNTFESIRNKFESTSFSFAPEKSFTLSAGIATLKENEDSSAWFDRADKALYFAKTHGRNQIIYSE